MRRKMESSDLYVIWKAYVGQVLDLVHLRESDEAPHCHFFI